jgi:peptidoglycan hydrolase-like protein with peptidoglycan-binding domain
MMRALLLFVISCAAAPAKPEPAAPKPESRKHTVRKAVQPEVAASPRNILEAGSVTKIQEALNSKGFGVEKNGKLDSPTKEAIASFQKKEKIAATGLPDQLTLRRLDLDPKEIFGGTAILERDELEVQDERER